MSIGENTVLLKRGCRVCNGFDFCGSLCINCTSSASKASLPISIKPCQVTQPKNTQIQSSLSSSLTVASPPPIFTLIEEEQFCERPVPSGQVSLSHQSSQPRQMAINEHLFKEYREASSTVGMSSSAFELTVSEWEEDSDGDDDDSEQDDDDEFSDESNDYPSTQWNFEDYFAGLPGNDWCVRIPESFIHDEFNLFEFPDVFRCPLRLTDFPVDPEKRYTEDYAFDDLLELLTTEDLEYSPDGLPEGMLMDAVLLYKLIHQRYILSKQGLQEMTEKYEAGDFGTCPRHLCRGQALLPVGLSALPAVAPCKVYCLNCQDLYTPASRSHAQSDGVAFGPTFAHFLVRNVLFGDAERSAAMRARHTWAQFVPKIYGFKISGKPESIRSAAPRDYQ